MALIQHERIAPPPSRRLTALNSPTSAVSLAGLLSIDAMKLQQQLAKERAWGQFLSRLQGPNALLARSVWARLRAVSPMVSIPTAGELPDGGFQMVWDAGSRHFNIELVEGRSVEWFCLNRRSLATAAGEFDADTAALPAALQLQVLAFPFSE